MTRQRVRFNVDPAVGATLSAARAKEKRQRRTRRRSRKTRRKQYEQFNVAIEPRVKRLVKAIAQAEGVSPSGVVELLAVLGIQRYLQEEGKIFDAHLRESQASGGSPDWVVSFGDGDLDQLVWDLEAFLDPQGDG